MAQQTCPKCGYYLAHGQAVCKFCQGAVSAQSETAANTSERPLNPALRFLFGHAVISPVLWFGGSIAAFVLLLVMMQYLLLASFPGALLGTSAVLGAASCWLFYRFAYPSLAAEGQGGFLPAVQRSLLGLAQIFGFLAGVGLMALGYFWLGGLMVMSLLLYSLFFARQLSFGKRQGLQESLQQLFSATERLKWPGVAYAERAAIWLFFSWGILCTLLFFEQISVARPVYQVILTDKQVKRGGKGGPTYQIYLKGWRQSSVPINYRVSYSEFEQLQVGALYKLATRRGLWGSEYVLQLKPDYAAMRKRQQ